VLYPFIVSAQLPTWPEREMTGWEWRVGCAPLPIRRQVGGEAARGIRNQTANSQISNSSARRP
jgi:hypothetical protein